MKLYVKYTQRNEYQTYGWLYVKTCEMLVIDYKNGATDQFFTNTNDQ